MTMMPKFYATLSKLKEKINTFYLLAFAALLLFVYYHTEWPFAIVIPIYGFILLLIKKQKLLQYHDANHIQKTLGVVVVFGSFFIYYATTPFYPAAGFYTAANYAVYLLGLCLTFFEVKALREASSSVFLIVAANASPFISAGLEPHLSPFITNQLAHLVAGVMNALGVNATIQIVQSSPVIFLSTKQGGIIPALFNWYCVGITSVLVFSIILVVLLIEEHNNLKSKVLWSMFGILGILILNVLRIIIIFLTDYFYGAEVGGTIHYIIGYAIFIAWLTAFLCLFSKKTVQTST